MIKKAKRIIGRIIRILQRKDMLVLPGQLAFFLLLGIVPTVTLTACLSSLFNISMININDIISNLFNEQVASMLTPIITEFKLSFESILILIVALYVSSNSASSIIVTSNELYGIKTTSFLHRKTKAIVMIILLLLVVVFGMLVPVFSNKLIDLVNLIRFNSVLDRIVDVIVTILKLSRGPISWIIMYFIIKLTYTMAPDGKVSSKSITKGSLFTTFGLIISTYIYSLFINHQASVNVVYGGLANFVVLMVWLYIISYIIIIGIAINAEDAQKELKNNKD